MAYIKGISYYLPDKIVSNEELLKEFPEWSVDKVAAKVGVNFRHVAHKEETAGDLAVKAAENLFKEYSVDPKTIDFVLFCTQSPDYLLPSTACIIQDRLHIPTTSGALDYNLGCSGCVYGLAMGKSFVDSGLAKNVLLLTAETYNKYIHPLDKSNRTIFGDGAAACLISNEGIAEIGNVSLGTDGSGYKNLIIETGGARKKEKTGIMTVDADGHFKYDDFLYMNGSAIFNFTLETVPNIITDTLYKNQLEQSEIDYYLFHQANKFMLNTIRKVCSLSKERFYINLEETGNTVSSTVLIGLKQCLDQGVIYTGMNVLIGGFGVGLSWAGTVLKF